MTRKTCILGLGKSGIAAARHALASGDSVTVYGGASSPAALAAAADLESQGARVIMDDEDVEGPFDLCVVCPGIPQTGAFYQSALAASAELIGEPEYAWRLSPADWLAITGTNGKTTTTALTAHILNECGISAKACGNIGDTAVEAVETRADGELLVAELSSFQLASTIRFAPRVAVLLNITPDHLAWHGGMEAYAQAKLKVFENMGEGDTAVLVGALASDSAVVEPLERRGVTLVAVQAPGERRAFEEGGVLKIADAGAAHALCTVEDLQIKGAHNVANALAAAAAAYALGCAPEAIGAALATFKAIEHRIEPAGEVGGVAFYNDSKATNVDAALVAVCAFAPRPVIAMFGGRDKLTDLSALVEACGGPVRHAVCYGEAGPRFAEAFAGSDVPCTLVGGFAEAFGAACSLAEPGDVVLLSPACASFDEFDSYNHRGDTFKRLVADLVASHG